MRGKVVASLELDYPIISVSPMLKSPWECDVPSPGEILVLLGKLYTPTEKLYLFEY